MRVEPDLRVWAEGEAANARWFADALGVPPEVYGRDPASLVPALQDYVSRSPFAEFEHSDWITLHADLMSYVADHLVRTYQARWNVVTDDTSPRGYRYVIEAAGRDGQHHRLDPARLVDEELCGLPLEITRLLARAEAALGLSDG
ncbi:hypothetical protein ACIPWL_06290 [Streptomyces sp. NPDC090023]|uniref:hypothetical protein n=1 Tax=unclassified Streptomyces TaxID=2593676 RepID=UPI00382EB5BC